ncbi:MAG: magnesium transporter, partial [Candidatus Obscuribacterales bacterium]|nr:magnesium transporter [Steroidobacteraceae bacterium]
MLVSCAVYQGGKKIADIGANDIHRYIAEPGCFVWVALSDPTPEELALMQDEFDLHPLAIEDAGHGEQRPKIEEYGDSLFSVLHMLELENGELRVGALHMFVGNNYILSVRRGAQKGFQDVRARSERE